MSIPSISPQNQSNQMSTDVVSEHTHTPKAQEKQDTMDDHSQNNTKNPIFESNDNSLVDFFSLILTGLLRVPFIAKIFVSLWCRSVNKNSYDLDKMNIPGFCPEEVKNQLQDFLNKSKSSS